MRAFLVIFPAYGRRYKNTADMLEDFFAGKDFSASYRGGPYLSVRDIPNLHDDFKGLILRQVQPYLSVIVACGPESYDA